MKKIFTLLTLLLCAITSTWATTTVYSYTCSSQDNTDGTYDATGGKFTVGVAKKYEADKGIKLDGDSGTKWVQITLSEGSTLQVGDVITIQEFASSSPTGADYGVAIGTTNFTAIANLYLPNGAKNVLTDVSYTVVANDGLEDKSSFYAFRCSGKSTYINAITITRPNSTAPLISAADASITATESGVAVTKNIAVRGTNLTGSTLTATLSPEVSGLSVSLGSSTITDGAIETTATLSYTATENTSGTTTLILSDGTTSKEVTITYSANVAQHTLQAVSETTTWDWGNISAITTSSLYNNNGIQLTEGSTPTKNDEFVLEDYNGKLYTIGEGFDGTTVAFKGEYPIRGNKSNKYCQNGIVKIKTTVPGTLVVKFSDTGSSASATAVKRYLQINGENTDYWTSRENNGEGNPYAEQLNVVTEPINVAAGEITISGSSAIIINYITFTPSTTESVPVNQYGKGTYVTTNALDFTGITTVTAYVATAQSGSDVTFDPVTKVPAGTPLLVKGATTDVPVIASAEEIGTNFLVAGSGEGVASVAGGKYNFILNYKDGAVGFYRAAGKTVAADRAYLSLDSDIPTSAKVNLIFSDEESTGINNVNAVENTNEKVFNLAGQQMKSAVKGVYIKNGRKYVK